MQTKKNELILTDEINEFIKLALGKQEFTFLTGAAGTGKSTALRHLVSSLSGTKIRYVVLSPTALAAINVNGQTIHSFFKLPIGIIHQSNLRIKRESLDLYAKMDLMIIDEISMVRADLLDAVDHILRMAKRNHKPLDIHISARLLLCLLLFLITFFVATTGFSKFIRTKFN